MKTERARRRLAEFSRQAWAVLNPGRPLEWAWYLDAICLHLEAVYRREPWARRLIITQPPNTLKSTLVSVCWPAWVWARAPETRFLYASSDGPLATRDAVAMRDLVTSPWYQQGFVIGDDGLPRWRLKADQDQKTWFNNTAGGHRISYSVGARVIGRKGDILVVDDANDAKKVRSPADRQAVYDWHDFAFSGRMADEQTSPEVAVAQRVDVGDLIGHLKRKGGWTELRLAEEFNPAARCVTPIWRDPRALAGEWLRPTRFGPDQKADRLKSLGTLGYAAQHLQEPKEGDGTIFKKVWFLPLVDRVPRSAARVRYWDTASTQDGGCFTAGVLIAKDVQGVYYVEDVVRFQLSALGRDQMIKATVQADRQKYGRVVQWVERQGGGSGKDVAEATVRMLAGFEVHIDQVTGEKALRAQPLASQAEARNVRVLDRPWTGEFLDELCAAPHGPYLDQFDAAAGAFTHVSQMHAGGGGLAGGLPGEGQGTMVPINPDAFR